MELAGSTAFAWPLSVRAQPVGRLPVVGFVLGRIAASEMAGPDPTFPVARAFVHGLRDLGWNDGRNIVIERRSAEGRPERAPALMAEMISRGVDVIVAGATDWLIDAAQKATRSIPIVAIFTEDPVATGRVANLARPGANLTGVTTTPGREMTEKRLALLKQLAPRISRVAFLGRRPAWAEYHGGAHATVIPPIFAPVDRPGEFEEAFATVLRERADALLVSHGPVMFVGAPRVVEFAKERRLPAIYPWREAVEAGGLMSYGTDAEGLFRQLAGFVDRILNGAKPAELPVQEPTTFNLVVNLRTAKALGIPVPQTILLRADEMIE